jgi:tRNA U34 5-methylaminomethyl-2-thiouridine-forming methyltransferase MnmC
MALQLITTGDGSHTLLNTDLNETYHSTHGAVQESQHVFIKNGLDFFIEQNTPDEINILEVGFGTGLNALLSLKQVQDSKIKIHYTSLEAFPILIETADQLSYPTDVLFQQSKELFMALHEAVWNEPVSILPNFTLEKRKITLQESSFRPSEFDLVYFDAFAPNKQPEMWELSTLRKVVQAIKPKGVFVTYCAKGQLKRDLKSFGMIIETLPGPPGKREMVRALK